MAAPPDGREGLPEILGGAVEELARSQGITPAEFARRCVASEVRRLRPDAVVPLAALWDPESPLTQMANAYLALAITGEFSEIQFVRNDEGFTAAITGEAGSEGPTELPPNIGPLLLDRYLEMAHWDLSRDAPPFATSFVVRHADREYRVGLLWESDRAGDSLTEVLTLRLTPA